METRLGPVELFAGQPLTPETVPRIQKPPVENDRGFLNPYQPQLKPTPTDKATGVTFPIVSRRPLPELGKSHNSQGEVVADWNHAYHPRERLKFGSLIEVALRNSRVEWVHRDDHNRYHKEFLGPAIGDEEQVLKQVLFSAAGFVPSKALQYDGRDEAKIVKLSRRKRQSLWQTGRIKVQNGITIRDGLMDLALRNDFNGIRESTIDEFLHTADLDRRYELGSSLLNLAVRDVVIPLRPLYKDRYERQQLKPEAPKDIGRFALKLVSHHKRTRALGILEGRLKAA